MTDALVHRIELPNPFFEGRTNAYVLTAEPLTLIDTGIGTDDAFCALEGGLRRHGLALADIKRVVLTHHHMDHFGQARRLRDLSGARVYVHEHDLDAVRRYEEGLPEVVARMRRLLGWAAAPAGDVDKVAALFLAGAGRLARSVPAEPLRDGDRLPAGDDFLEVIHTPGHTLGSVCLRYGRRLFTGDHVLPDVSPNIGSDVTGTRLLARYLASLERVKALQRHDLKVFPGHGDPFTDLRGRADALITHHARREQELLDLMRARAASTIYRLATDLFGTLEGFHLILGVAETWAHLEKLVEDGRAVQEGDRFRAA